MTAINKDHARWAAIDRLGKMLDERGHPAYSVTESYALFTAVLCWCIEQLRSDKDEMLDKLAHATLLSLDAFKPGEYPWHIVYQSKNPWRVKRDRNQKKATDVETAADALIWLRNQVAHGDGRKIVPIPGEDSQGRPILKGFCFNDAVTLSERDMRRIGSRLAKIFCNGLDNIMPISQAAEFKELVSQLPEMRI